MCRISVLWGTGAASDAAMGAMLCTNGLLVRVPPKGTHSAIGSPSLRCIEPGGAMSMEYPRNPPARTRARPLSV